jgi:ankyrin repeat protein
VKLVREHINEKFTEESDPIKDMNIGIMHDIREFVNKVEGINLYSKENLLLYCAKHDKNEFVKFLINDGADIHAYKDIALSWAVQNKNLELAKVLIDNGANVNVNSTYTLLSIAMYNEDKAMIKLLKDNGAIEKNEKQLLKDIKKEGRRLFKINKK